MSRLMLCVVKRCVEIFAILKTALRVPGLNLGSVVIYRWWSKCGPSMSKCKNQCVPWPVRTKNNELIKHNKSETHAIHRCER